MLDGERELSELKHFRGRGIICWTIVLSW